MNHYLIVVVNRALARFFTVEPVEYPELESSPRIMSCGEIENPEINQGRDMFADSKTGRGAAPQGGSVHGYDDRREKHLDELRRRFAARVVDNIHKMSKERASRRIILVSSARMRRFLYPDMDKFTRQGYQVHKLSKNMIKFSPQKIHEYLAESDLVPGQK